MADQTLLQLPINTSLTTGDYIYEVSNNSSYAATINSLAQLLLNAYGLVGTGNLYTGYVTTGQVNPLAIVYTSGNQTINGNKVINSGFFPLYFSGNQLIVGNLINSQNNNSVILNNNIDKNLYIQNNTGNIVLTTNNLRGSGINLNGYTYCNGPLYIYNSTGFQTGLQVAYFDGGAGQITINDASENQSADFQNRLLFNLDSETLDWGNSFLLNNTVVVMDWDNSIINDNSDTSSILWGTRNLLDFNGKTGLNWGNRYLYDTGSMLSADWSNRVLKDSKSSTGISSVDWGNRQLIDQNGNIIFSWASNQQQNINPYTANIYNFGITVGNWSKGILYDNYLFFPNFTGIESIDWFNRRLYDTNQNYVTRQNTSVVSLDWNNRLMYDNSAGVGLSGTLSLDWGNRLLVGAWTASGFVSTGQIPYLVFTTGKQSISGFKSFNTIAPNYISGSGIMVDSANLPSIQWNNRYLTDTLGNNSVDWQNKNLTDSNNVNSLQWSNRLGFDNTGLLSIDWSNRILVGSWNVAVTGISGYLATGNIIAGTGISVNASGNNIIISYSGPQLYIGSGNPNGIITANSGSIYSDYFNRVQYNKWSGNGNLGWS